MKIKRGKVIDGKIKYAPSVLWQGDTCVCCPTANDYEAAGWREVVDEMPEAREGYYFAAVGWRDGEDGKIHRVYEEREVPKDEEVR